MQPVPLAVIAAIDDEIKIISSKMAVDSRVHVRPSLFTLGKYMNRPLLLARSGIGIAAMEDAARYCIEHHRPAFFLHVGYCGGADPKYQPGDLIVANVIVDSRDGTRHEADAKTVERALAICSEKNLRANAAGIVTMKDVVADPHEKAFVGTEHEAHAIDMESAAFVAACRAANIPHLVVRAVLDPLDVALPDMADVLDEQGQTDTSALAGHLMKQPKDILSLPRIAYFATQAREAITEFVNAWIQTEAQ